jgi:hypothetical protein
LTEFALVEIVLVDGDEKRCDFWPFFGKYDFRAYAQFFWKFPINGTFLKIFATKKCALNWIKEIKGFSGALKDLRHMFSEFIPEKLCLGSLI